MRVCSDPRARATHALTESPSRRSSHAWRRVLPRCAPPQPRHERAASRGGVWAVRQPADERVRPRRHRARRCAAGGRGARRRAARAPTTAAHARARARSCGCCPCSATRSAASSSRRRSTTALPCASSAWRPPRPACACWTRSAPCARRRRRRRRGRGAGGCTRELHVHALTLLARSTAGGGRPAHARGQHRRAGRAVRSAPGRALELGAGCAPRC